MLIVSQNIFIYSCLMWSLWSYPEETQWMAPRGILGSDGAKSKHQTDSTFWPIWDWNNSSSVLTASCCHLPVIFCLSSEWHSHVPHKLNQTGTLSTLCRARPESRCSELPMTTSELIVIDGFVYEALFISSSLVRACVHRQTSIPFFLRCMSL